MGCCAGAAGAGVAVFAAGGDGAASGCASAGAGGGGGGTNAGGAELTGAAGAGIEDDVDEDEVAVVSCVRGSDEALFECGPELLPEGAAAGGGGAILLAALPPEAALDEAMIEFKCMDDLDDSEWSEVDFLGLGLGSLDSISIVVSGPVPREHWNRTREMMRATCWSRMWLMTRPSRRCSCCMKRGRLSGCLARWRSVPAARRSMSRLVPIESGLSRR